MGNRDTTNANRVRMRAAETKKATVLIERGWLCITPEDLPGFIAVMDGIATGVKESGRVDDRSLTEFVEHYRANRGEPCWCGNPAGDCWCGPEPKDE